MYIYIGFFFFQNFIFNEFDSLPPASEGWGKVLFSVCTPARSGWLGGGTPARFGWLGGVPQPGLDDWGGGGYPGQVWMGYPA